MSDYREPDDPEYFVRCDVALPDGVEELHECGDEIPVAGCSQVKRQKALQYFIDSPERALLLEREPTNRHDANAIKVFAWWRWGGAERVGQIGYVPAHIAALIAERHAGKHLHAVPVLLFRARDELGYDAGIRMRLGASSTREARAVASVPPAPRGRARRQAPAAAGAQLAGHGVGAWVFFLAVVVVMVIVFASRG